MDEWLKSDVKRPCVGTTQYLEPYFEGYELKRMNFSGPGNSVCSEYIKENPPITRINGIRYTGDESALAHDLRYGEALEETDPIVQKALMREADRIFIEQRQAEYDKTGLGYAGLKGISYKMWLEENNPALARQIFRSYYAGP